MGVYTNVNKINPFLGSLQERQKEKTKQKEKSFLGFQYYRKLISDISMFLTPMWFVISLSYGDRSQSVSAMLIGTEKKKNRWDHHI